MSEERKQRHLQQLGKKESTFLRLRRTKLGLDDFRTVKVIGKGAFGEASIRVSLECVLKLVNTYLFEMIGPLGSENRHGEDIRHEDIEEGRDVKERPGFPIPSS